MDLVLGDFILQIIGNRETGQSRGFGFVTMSTVEEADKAVEMFHRYVSLIGVTVLYIFMVLFCTFLNL